MAQDHFHVESLETFLDDLADAGFHPVPEFDRTRWTGPIHPAFAGLTPTTTMDVVIVPGWPFQPPAVFVQGLSTSHSTINGLVCMWQDGDFSRQWTSVEGLFSRIEEWCEDARGGWQDDNLEHDAYLNFQRKAGLVATIDHVGIGVHESSWGEFAGLVHRNPFRIDILSGRKRSADQLRGLWFHAGVLTTPPPRNLSEVSFCLPRSPRKGLQRALAERKRPEALVDSGGVDLIVFCWKRQDRTNLLVMACREMNKEVEAIALQPGPTDEESLLMRAGPDAPALRGRSAVIFGAGALGGYTATTLAQSGIGSLRIVDGDVLLPGNVVRHVAGHDKVGAPKVKAVREIIANHAPWTEVTMFQESPRTPSRIHELATGVDIAVDTTGSEALTYSLAMVAQDSGMPVVSGALYRGGGVARVQRQARPTDTPILQRVDLSRYPPIPPGDGTDEFAEQNLGCSAPVNNAPPFAVQSCAALIVQVAIDALTERFEFEDELIEVYRAVAEPPFYRPRRLDQPPR